MHESQNGLLFGTPYAFPIFFLTLWCGSSFFVGWMSGWFALSRRFTKQSDPYGETRSAGPFFYTVYTRFWSHYSSVIRLVATKDALYFSVLFLFRIGHPPLCIPWNEIVVRQNEAILQALRSAHARRTGADTLSHLGGDGAQARYSRTPCRGRPTAPEPSLDTLSGRFAAFQMKKPGYTVCKGFQ